jgi:F-type H+-transporting ATPase subunit gamma
MANTQGLKQRIRSVKSTRQITKAMQLVAASKMRKAQEATKASSAYTLAARELLATISAHSSVKDSPRKKPLDHHDRIRQRLGGCV